MFGSSQNYEPVHTGKKIVGSIARKEPEFSLGWDNNNQMNSYQSKLTKNGEITGKIGTQGFSGSKPTTGVSVSSNIGNQSSNRGYQPSNADRQPAVLKQVNSSKIDNSPYEMSDYKLFEYERLLRQYPDIPAEELQRIVMGFQEKIQPPQNNNPISQGYDRQQGYGSSNKKEYEVQSIQREQPMNTQKREAVRPRESMKDIIYGGREIGSENENPQKKSFRRNNTNLILGDGYNYFKNPY